MISAVARRGLRRQYSPDVLLRLNLIIMGKTASFSLAEIAGMFGRDGKPEISRDLCSAKARDLNDKINDLMALVVAIAKEKLFALFINWLAE